MQLYLNLNDLGMSWKFQKLHKLLSRLEVLSLSEKVEMTEKVVLYQPYEAEQILLAENASCLAVKTYLKMLGREFVVSSHHNCYDKCKDKGLSYSSKTAM